MNIEHIEINYFVAFNFRYWILLTFAECSNWCLAHNIYILRVMYQGRYMYVQYLFMDVFEFNLHSHEQFYPDYKFRFRSVMLIGGGVGRGLWLLKLLLNLLKFWKKSWNTLRFFYFWFFRNYHSLKIWPCKLLD